MKSKNSLFIYFSLFFALALDATYLFPSFEVVRPSIVLLVIVYWNIALPDKVGVSYSVTMGLILDLLRGSILGSHSLIFVLISYLCQRFFYQFRVMSLFQQSFILFIVFLLVKMYWVINSSLFMDQEIEMLINKEILINMVIYALFNSLIWPLIFSLLRPYRRKWIK